MFAGTIALTANTPALVDNSISHIGYMASGTVKNDTAAIIYLGASSAMTAGTTTGFPLGVGESFHYELQAEALWACASINTALRIIRRGP